MSEFRPPAKPSYIPEKVYKSVCFTLENVERHLKTLLKNDKIKESNADTIKIYNDTRDYLLNFISEDGHLKKFFDENKHNEDLFNSVIRAFQSMAEWKYDFKRTKTEEKDTIHALEIALSKAAARLQESPDIRLPLQLFWEGYIRSLLSKHRYKGYLTEKGKEYLCLIRKLVFGGSKDATELESNNLICCKPTIHNIPVELDLSYALSKLSEKVSNIREEIDAYEPSVKKINSSNAHIHYIIRKLKRVFTECNVNSRKHVSYIVLLTNTLLQNEPTEVSIDEDSVRKLISRT